MEEKTKRIEKISCIKSWFFEINKIDNLLPERSNKERKEITNISNKRAN